MLPGADAQLRRGNWRDSCRPAGYDSGPLPVAMTCYVARDPQSAQHELPNWMGGQATVPYEQNTQQSPGFGFSKAPQDEQS